MRRVLLCAGLIAAGALPAASGEVARLPRTDPAHSTCPNLSSGKYWIDLVATRSGVIDPYGTFTVVARDLTHTPVPDVSVRVVFSCSDFRIDPSSALPGQTVHCEYPPGVWGTTGADGSATFVIAGAGTNTNGSPTGCGVVGATVYIENIQICQCTVAVYDQNGAATNPGLEITDLAAWLNDFGKQGVIGYKGRSDYSHNGTIDILDMVNLLRRMGSRNSSEGAIRGYCP